MGILCRQHFDTTLLHVCSVGINTDGDNKSFYCTTALRVHSLFHVFNSRFIVKRFCLLLATALSQYNDISLVFRCFTKTPWHRFLIH